MGGGGQGRKASHSQVPTLKVGEGSKEFPSCSCGISKPPTLVSKDRVRGAGSYGSPPNRKQEAKQKEAGRTEEEQAAHTHASDVEGAGEVSWL